MEPITLSPWALFVQAGPVVKVVMLVLLTASVWCWVVIVELMIALRRIDRALARARRNPETAEQGVLAPVFDIVADAPSISRAMPNEVRQHITDAMRRAARRLLAQAERGLPNLAVISSVAPFIGLFGTVWGIMTSFAGIAEAKETSLAIVAPGIAEALAATAYGLAAAIPASIAYNRIGAAFSHRGQDIADMIEERATALMASRSKQTESV
jgi:biopolymer transport protein ExbB/TolQ